MGGGETAVCPTACSREAGGSGSGKMADPGKFSPFATGGAGGGKTVVSVHGEQMPVSSLARPRDGRYSPQRFLVL